ncbi:M12 family metallopeptidase [Neolewinella agarilytica]|uniref:M12 family metallopeptidase n=1 Tax=Neolewinella agarilytica TaxID=478744 RepID=UPI0023534D19|nr:M12 family metallopeptidase [Neolewinella agarilytica]
MIFFGVFSIASAQHIHTCTVIPSSPKASVGVPANIPDGAQKAVSYKPGGTFNSQWSVGSTLTVKFFGGSSYLQDQVMRYAREWTQYANVNFRVVSSGTADIRVSFTQNGASWSMVGTSSAHTDQNRPSMNFGWLNDRTSDYEIKRTVLHEFGHALGLLHEHQNPAGGIPWDEAAVYDHYWRTQGWDRQMTYNNVMATAERDATQYSAYDRASIMHYPVAAQLTGGRYEVGMNSELSETDKMYIARMYPGRYTSSGRPTGIPVSNPPVSTPPVSAPPTRVTNYRVQINNALGKQQKSETVQLFIADKRYTIRLAKDARQRQQLNLDLPKGKYPYRVVVSSTYFGYRKVRVNGVVRREYAEIEIPGDGRGILTVDGSESLTLFGSYDEASQRLKVYLGESR